MRHTTILATLAITAATAVAHMTKPGSHLPFQTKEKLAQKAKNIKASYTQENDSGLNPQEMWFANSIDHYTNNGANSTTYQQRYLVDETFYNATSGQAPIIFYAGNEGDVWTFFDNSGFMTTTLPEEFGALVVFGEHRYYGESLPYGDDSYDFDNLSFLTVEQAMMDYVELIKSIKESYGMQDRAVIVGGGSYGGMLSAWLRMKFPQWFQGALAASAPILFFDGYVDPNAYDDIATNDFRMQGESCPTVIQQGFEDLANLADHGTSSDFQAIQEIFGTCTVPTGASDIQALIDTLDGSLGTMAMVDYPYPTSFIEPMPAWPIDVACQNLRIAVYNHDEDPYVNLYGIAAAGTVFYNYEGQLDCLDTSTEQGGGLDGNGWAVQACNEMVMPFASNSTTSMFPPAEWDKTTNSAYCLESTHQDPQYEWALKYFGGMKPEKDFMKASNIIFSNGELDPWKAGGVTSLPDNDQCLTLLIENSAHHLDLRLPNEADPSTVTEARQTEMEWIAKFIDQYQGSDFSSQVALKGAKEFIE